MVVVAVVVSVAAVVVVSVAVVVPSVVVDVACVVVPVGHPMLSQSGHMPSPEQLQLNDNAEFGYVVSVSSVQTGQGIGRNELISGYL